MSRLPILAASMAALLFVAGCASPEIPFDRSGAGNIRTIGVVTPDIPEKPSVILASDPGQSFGLVGGLIDAGMQLKRDDQLYAILVQRHFGVGQTLSTDLASALKARGFDAKPISVSREKSGFLKTYPTEPGVDAYLDVSSTPDGFGYVAAGIGASQPYRPFVWLNVKLVRASDASVLMQDTVMYNPIWPNNKWVTMSPDPNYQFADFDAITGQADLAVKGIDTSLHQTADQISMLMR